MSALRIEREGAVARVWLDRPEVRNALDGTLIRALAAAFTALAGEDGVRVIVLGGRGKAFCAGADLAFMREAANYTWEQNQADAAALAEMLWSIYSCPVPVVARIHGDCYAGGIGIAAVCDIRVVAEGVTFSLSEARLGLLPATISPYVIRAIGEPAARRYFVTAERLAPPRRRRSAWRTRCAAPTRSTPTSTRIVAAHRRQRADGDARLQAAGAEVAGREISAELRADTARRIADIRASAEARRACRAFSTSARRHG